MEAMKSEETKEVMETVAVEEPVPEPEVPAVEE